MQNPVLVIMAAGMGGRFGGLKQIEPVDQEGHIIMDFSIFDAKRAGFKKVIFIIKKENEVAFKEAIGNRIEEHMQVAYVFQEIENLPDGYDAPFGRVKPWGTAHAVLSCIEEVKEPFAVINADDYYGKEAFQEIYNYLQKNEDDHKYRYTMVGYNLYNTLTENGHVSRGVCQIDDQQELVGIQERIRIEHKEQGVAYTEDDGATWIALPEDTVVSMNMWGFSTSILQEINNEFKAFLNVGLKEQPLTCEYFLPTVVAHLLEKEQATVKVLPCKDKWYGITYKEDKPVIVKAIEGMKKVGEYPKKLWDKA